jgi:hypothetical protein
MRFIDRDFESPLAGKEIKDHKGIKIGKILGSQYNTGTVMIELPKLYKNGRDARYFLEDYPVIMW